MFKVFAEIKRKGNTTAHHDCDNASFSFNLVEEGNVIKGVFKAKKDMALSRIWIKEKMDFSDSDLFFANGYQSWTSSCEFGKNDCLTGETPAAKISKLTYAMATVFSDYRFAEYGKQGRFHSYTYCYFRKKGERNITLYGSKSERQGYTVFSVDMNKGEFKIAKDVEGLVLKAGQEYEMFNVIRIDDEFDAAFDKYFFDFVGTKEPKIKHLSGYTSWYNYFQKINEEIILRDLDGMDRAKDSVNIFQVDDGYESAVGDWLVPDAKKFPHGMKYIADKIHDKGYLAGIWIAPFSAQTSSKVFKEHKDWFIKDSETGKPLLGCPGWGLAYTLDIYNPEAREYIAKFFDVFLNEWGYDMVKLDFLYSQCVQPRNGKTRGEIMCDAVDFLRECCGDKLILGCGVPLGTCMGIFDACRISCDANKAYNGDLLNRIKINNEIPSCRFAINNAIFRNHLDGRAFCNDPDVFFLRDFNIKFTLEQKLLLGKINAICGNVLFVSDDAGRYDNQTVKYLVDFFDDRDYKVLFAEYESADDVRLDFSENGVKKTLRFNIETGVSNIMECL